MTWTWPKSPSPECRTGRASPQRFLCRWPKAGISVDTIVQNASANNITDLTFTITKNDVTKAMEIIKPVAKEIGAKECLSDSKLGKVSIIGTGMQNTPGYAAKMFQTLSAQNINIQLITTSEIRITCIIAEDKVKEAVKALHKAFELDKGLSRLLDSRPLL